MNQPTILFTPVSGNAKTGPIPVTYSHSSTCPDDCGLKKKGCYAENGKVAMHWRRLDSGKTGIAWKEFIAKVKKIRQGQLWRHNISGDLPGTGNQIDHVSMAELVEANRRKRGFTYTHSPVLIGEFAKANREAIYNANKNGFTVNLSANNLHHADTLASLGIAPVVTVLSEKQTKNCLTPAGRKVVVCPATIKDNVTCSDCGLCQWKDRSYIIGFPVHGVAKKKAELVATSQN